MKALLFDMDGVLVDVSYSYRLAVLETVRYFSGQTVSFDEIQVYKNRGNLNNDWYLTLAILQDKGVDPGIEKVINIFQTFYLGEDFDGLILNEKWIPSRPALKELTEQFKLGVVTGRPQAEAMFTLNKFQTGPYFQTIITLDDLPAGNDKPDPWGINRALDILGVYQGYYVGDSVDDILAASAAGLIPVGFVLNGNKLMKQALIDAGAEIIVTGMNQLKEVL